LSAALAKNAAYQYLSVFEAYISHMIFKTVSSRFYMYIVMVYRWVRGASLAVYRAFRSARLRGLADKKCGAVG
jgi:hypothetical protein